MAVSTAGYCQKNVPLGIHYQAVARDRYGNELVNTKISVKFSIISEDPLSSPVYQELHQTVTTSKFGVFSIVIGRGVPTGNSPCTSLSEIEWGMANHFLKVEVKFENEFMDMGTMQFLAVPYALYAQKSLEPGPQGPKGEQGERGLSGDPASDDQTLSVVNIEGSDYLALSGGNQVKISSIEKDGDPANEIQDLVYDNATHELRILKSTAPAINLSELKNDADSDPSNEIQTITYNPDNFQLTLSKGGAPVTVGQVIALRAGISSTVNLPDNTPVDILFDQLTNTYYNDGGCYNSVNGRFTAPYAGIYNFSVSLNLPINSSVIINLNGEPYETIIGPTTSVGNFRGTIAMKLSKGCFVNVIIKQNNGYPIPFSLTGSFSGFRLY